VQKVREGSDTTEEAARGLCRTPGRVATSIHRAEHLRPGRLPIPAYGRVAQWLPTCARGVTMAVEEHRRIALHRAAAETWGEEVADTLVDMFVPSGHEPSTRADVRALRSDVDGLRTDVVGVRADVVLLRGDVEALKTDVEALKTDVEALKTDVEALKTDVVGLRADIALLERRWDERFAAMDVRAAAMDERWDLRMESLGHRLSSTFERRISAAVTTQTKTLVFSQLGAVVVIAGFAFGLR
jgi:outer membrane murein-binding lipoprotein Lpp